MEKGFLITDEGIQVDLKAAKAAGYPIAYGRAIKVQASGGRKDDAQLTQNRKAFQAAGLSYGIFMDFDWRNGVKALDLATEFAAHCTAEDLLPPAIRLWDIKGVAVTSWPAFTTLLAELIYYLELKVHRYPVIMANKGQIQGITDAMAKLSEDQRKRFPQCWWGLISWGVAAAPELIAPWSKYPFLTTTNHIVSIPGAQNVGMMEWPGSLAQLSTWCKNPTMENLPAWGAVVVEDPPKDPPAGEVTLARVSAQLTTLQASLDKLSAHLGGK